jgi:hypothetical protein
MAAGMIIPTTISSSASQDQNLLEAMNQNQSPSTPTMSSQTQD